LAETAPAVPVEVEQLQVLLKDFQPPLKVSFAGGEVIVSGRITTRADKAEFEQVMERFPDAVDMVNVEVSEPLIGINALFIEVEAGSGHDITVLDPEELRNLDAGGYYRAEKGWYEEPTEPWHKEVGWSVNASIELLRSIRAMVEKGTAKVIARPRVVVQSGERASLLSGGEMPYTASNWQGTNTQFKQYGIRLEVVPELLSSGDVEMDLVVESSEPASNRSADITARRATTRVTVGNGKSLLVAGLSSTSSHSRGGFGCFFPLFTSGRTYKKTELLVLVTPEVPPGLGLGDFRMIEPKDTGK
jgi:pilus assembly protein CpaC